MGRKQKYNEEEREASNRYNSIKSRLKDKAINLNWDKEDFIVWYIKESKKKCFYCNSSLEDIKNFYNILPQNKRNLVRGKSLEIDRIEDKDYSKDNCVFACYYCNNAKSDIFTKEEFKTIGKSIGRVIKNKIRNYEKKKSNKKKD